jgi:dihydrofolate reductase
MGERMAAGGGLTGWLFGRWTYEALLSHWNSQPDNPFVTSLNDTHKYVASASPSTTLRWPNSTLISGNISEEVRSLKARSTGVLAIMGSGQLVRSLMVDNLIDEYLLMIHPLVLGHGQRLFSSGVELKLRLTSGDATPTGLVIATYEPATA